MHSWVPRAEHQGSPLQEQEYLSHYCGVNVMRVAAGEFKVAETKDGSDKLTHLGNMSLWEADGFESDFELFESMCVIISDAIWMGQLVSMDNDAGQDVGPVDIPNDSKEFVTTSIKPYVENSNTNACIHLGDTHWCADDSTNGPGIGTDTFSCQTDGLKGHMDALSASNGAETVEISHGDGTGTYLGAGCMKHSVDATDGIVSHTDMSIGFRHTKCCK